jgi:hypothetical protein
VSAHTPGPWAASPVAGWGDELHVVAEAWCADRPMFMAVAHPSRYYHMLRRVSRHGHHWSVAGPRTVEGEAEVARRNAEMAANVRLIAAAPKLLEALQGMLDEFNFPTPERTADETAVIRAALAAIAEATGATP